jgi:hypothetical protein
MGHSGERNQKNLMITPYIHVSNLVTIQNCCSLTISITIASKLAPFELMYCLALLKTCAIEFF